MIYVTKHLFVNLMTIPLGILIKYCSYRFDTNTFYNEIIAFRFYKNVEISIILTTNVLLRDNLASRFSRFYKFHENISWVQFRETYVITLTSRAYIVPLYHYIIIFIRSRLKYLITRKDTHTD